MTAYEEYVRQGTREDSCLICGRSSAEQRVAHLTTKGGLHLLLCQTCTDRWTRYGLVIETEVPTPPAIAEKNASLPPVGGHGSAVAEAAATALEG